RLRLHPVAAPVEIAGACAGALAVVLALGRAPVLPLVLALCGVIAAGTAVRVERRPVAGYGAAGLFVLASWVRLAASGVGAPEAYTLPVTVPALAVGLLRRRRDPEASSWTAYGPGLAATLLPSLMVVQGDPHWARPLLLGLGALAVTLAGARFRLQAPLVLGGAALALVGLHELAPYVVQVVGALPRWLPPALAGLLLLAVGATYEHRLRDARRLRDGLNRLR
uniref:SCO7613 C-terminal domain-containing membrane protein n=1 Tax=Streptomyces sp. SID1121 TaxID=3425888 RepID=UPI004057309C